MTLTSYLSESEVESGLGFDITATSTLITSTQLAQVLTRTTALINGYLETDTNLTGRGEEICKSIQLDLVSMHIMRLRKFKDQNLQTQYANYKEGKLSEEGIGGGYNIDLFSVPLLTAEHKMMLQPYISSTFIGAGYVNYSGGRQTL